MLIFGQKSCLTKIKSYCITYFLSNSSVFLVSTFALFGLPHMSEDYKYYVIPYAAPYILPILQTFLTISVYATVAIGQNIVLFSSSYSLRLWVMRQNETMTTRADSLYCIGIQPISCSLQRVSCFSPAAENKKLVKTLCFFHVSLW